MASLKQRARDEFGFERPRDWLWLPIVGQFWLLNSYGGRAVLLFLPIFTGILASFLVHHTLASTIVAACLSFIGSIVCICVFAYIIGAMSYDGNGNESGLGGAACGGAFGYILSILLAIGLGAWVA